MATTPEGDDENNVNEEFYSEDEGEDGDGHGQAQTSENETEDEDEGEGAGEGAGEGEDGEGGEGGEDGSEDGGRKKTRIRPKKSVGPSRQSKRGGLGGMKSMSINNGHGSRRILSMRSFGFGETKEEALERRKLKKQKKEQRKLQREAALSQCTVSALSVLTVLMASVGVSMAAYGAFGMESILLVFVPRFSMYLLIALMGSSLVLSVLMDCAISKFSKKLLLTIYPCFGFVAVLQLLLLILLASAYYDASMFESVDNSVAGVSSHVEETVIEFALKDNDRWASIQDKYDCCGFDFKAYYMLRRGHLNVDVVNQDSDEENEESGSTSTSTADLLEVLLNGDECDRNGARDELDELFQEAPGMVYTAEVEKYYLDNAVITSDNNEEKGSPFFCRAHFVEAMSRPYLIVTIAAGVQTFFQLTICIAAAYILCYAPGFGKEATIDDVSNLINENEDEDEDEDEDEEDEY